MNNDSEADIRSTDPPMSERESLGALKPNSPFYQRTDWLSFCMASLVSLAGYLWTLAPDVTLGMAGLFATGAMYAGVPHPPGYPLWTIYAWLFASLLPFSNIACRVATSSAVAASVACGLIALMVSRGGAAILHGLCTSRMLPPGDAKRLRIACGVIAGLGFAFDNAFWGHAVIADPWPLSVMLFAVTLALLMRWLEDAGNRRWLYAAFFIYGLTLSNSQFFFAAAFGLLTLVVLGEPKLRRDISFANSVLCIVGLLANEAGYFPVLDSQSPDTNLIRGLFICVGAASISVCAFLTLKTRRLLTEWKPLCLLAVMLLLGVTPHLYVPIASMTNPPVNWGYARTVEGFWHVLSRGQYERLHPTNGFGPLLKQLNTFGTFGAEDLGWAYVAAALIPFCCFTQMCSRSRTWMLGLIAVYLCLSLLVLMTLNPPPDRQAREPFAHYFAASHLILALWAGYGLILVGTLHTRSREN